MENICKNKDCGKPYRVKENEIDDGFCSFECWEKVNCKQPENLIFEELKLNEI